MKKRGSVRGQVRAQVSMEFLMVVGFAFMMTAPLIIIFYQQSQNINTEVTSSQLDKVASEVRDAADEVYYLGSPSMKTITIYMPKGVKSITIANNSIKFVVSSPGKDYDLMKWTVANLTGSIRTFEGIHHISAESHDTYVNISD
jgi:uncharacterized protein (UPF0333 family)